MYSSKPRPVPSKGALRVLYQLAYVSSGAALGVGVLCAEERRRRTQIIQRIADNAKILRQSPRCVHTAVTTQAFLESAPEFQDEQWDIEQVPSHRKRRRRKHELDGDVPWWAPQLPSVVEAEYNHVRQRDQNGAVRSVPNRRPTRVEGDVHQTSRQSTPWGLVDHSHRDSNDDLAQKKARLRSFNLSATASKPAQAAILRQPHRAKPNIRQEVHGLLRSKNGADTQRSRIEYPNRVEDQVDPAIQFDESTVVQRAPITRSQTLASRSTAADNHGRNRGDSTIVACEAQLEETDTGKPEYYINTQQLARDIEDFLAHANSPLLDQSHISSKLLQAAKVNGSLDNIKSLVLWKIANDCMKATEFVHLCCIAALLARRLEHESLMAFYIELMQTTYYNSLEAKAKARSSLGILHAGLKMKLEMNTTELFEQCIRPINSPNELKHFARATMAKVERHLEKGNIDTAGSLFWYCGKRLRLPDNSIADRLFTLALSNGSFWVAVRSLQWKMSHSDSEDTSAQVNQLIAALEERQAWDMLASLFAEDESGFSRVFERSSSSPGQVYPDTFIVPDKPCLPSEGLSWDALQSIALAYSDNSGNKNHSASMPSTSRLPPHLQRHAQRLNASASLRSVWLSTSDLKFVKERHHFMLADVPPHDQERVTELNLELVEILILADKSAEAIELMRPIVKSADSHSAMLVAFGLAQRSQWEALDRLFRMLKDHPFRWSPTSRRMFHHVIRLYADDHSAKELWSFTVRAIEHLKLEVNNTTAGLVISRFTAQGAIELILPWICYVKTMGLEYTMTTHTVNDLIKAWYLNFRPPHQTVLKVTRRVAASHPTLTNEQLVEIVKESLGYDMRKARFGSRERESAGYRARLLSKILSQTSQQPLHVTLNMVISADGITGPNRPQLPSIPKSLNRPPELQNEQRHTKQDDAFKSNLSVKLAGSVSQDATSEASNVTPSMTAKRHSKGRALANKMCAGESDMLFALSIQDYDGVSHLYDQSLRLDGAPPSLRSLEIAIEASLLRHKGDPTDAECILHQAREAGVGVNCAIGQILTHQIKKLNLKKANANKDLRAMVISYYRSNEASGKSVKHHVATAAAERLLESGSPGLAIDLLDDVLRSHWAAQKPFELATMTLYLKCFAMLRDFEGVKKIFDAVWAAEGMQLGRSFADALRSAQHLFKNRTDPNRLSGYTKEQINEELSTYRQMYRERSHGQVAHAIRVGTRLGNTILKIAKMQKDHVVALEDPPDTSVSAG